MDRHPPTGSLFVLSECSHFVVKYGPAILVVLTASIVPRRWFSTRKAKRRRLQFGLGTVLVTVAVVAVTVTLLNAWLLAPYRAEQHAAAALTQLGGKVVLVDAAPRWLRSYVGNGNEEKGRRCPKEPSASRDFRRLRPVDPSSAKFELLCGRSGICNLGFATGSSLRR